MYEIKEDDMFTLKSGKYIALSKTKLNDQEYIFTNKLDQEEEPTNKFLVFKVTDAGLVEEKDRVKLSKLLDYFSEVANEKLEYVNYFMEEQNGRA